MANKESRKTPKTPTQTGKTTPKGHAVILGINARIRTLTRLLREQGREVVIVTQNAEAFAEELEDIEVVDGDFLDRKNLIEARVEKADTVIILAETINHKPHDADARSVVATLAAESLNPNARTIVEALSEDAAYHLRNADVDEIIVSGELTADILAFSTNHPSYSNHLGVLLRFAYRNRIVSAPVKERLRNKPLKEANLILAQERKILMGVRTGGKSRNETLDPMHVLQEGDEIVYIDIL